MNATDASTLLKVEVQWDSAPALLEAEISHLLRNMATVDSTGKAPTDDGWTPTYDETRLSYAAYRGWLMKAGKVAGMVSYQADGARFDVGLLEAQCRNQAAEIRRRMVFSVSAREAIDAERTAIA